MNGHKDSDLLLIVQEKAKVNAISKEKRMRRAKDPKRSSDINNVRNIMHWYGLYTYTNSPRPPLMVNTANE